MTNYSHYSSYSYPSNSSSTSFIPIPSSSYSSSVVPVQQFTKLHEDIFLSIAIIYGIIVLISTVLFFIKGRSAMISNRSVFLTCLAAIFNLFASEVFLLDAAYKSSVPCFLNLWACYLGAIPYITGIITRSLRIVFLFRLNEAKLKQASPISAKSVSPLNDNTKEDWYLQNRKLFTDRYIGKLLAIALVIDIAVVLIIQFNSHGPISVQIYPFIVYNCTKGWEFYPFYAFIGIYSFIIGPYLIYLLRSVHDSFDIRHELILAGIVAPISIILYYIWLVTFQARLIEYWNMILFPVMAFGLVHVLSVIIPLIHLARDERRLRMQASDAGAFQEILRSDTLYAKFCKFCVSDLCSENCRFLSEYQLLGQRVVQIAAIVEAGELDSITTPTETVKLMVDTNDQHQNVILPRPVVKKTSRSIISGLTGSSNGHVITPKKSIAPFSRIAAISDIPLPENISSAITEHLRPDYLSFYQNFIVPGSPLEVNLSSGAWMTIAAKIQRNELSIDMFDAARKEVLELLFTNTFPRFLERKSPKHGSRRNSIPPRDIPEQIPADLNDPGMDIEMTNVGSTHSELLSTITLLES